MVKNMSERKIYLLSGIMGEGKNYFLEENDLDMFSLSMDEIRKLNTTPVVSTNGLLSINNTKNTMVYEKFKEMLKNKMLDGGLIIVNNMYIEMADIKNIQNFAKKMHYEIAIINFPLKSLDHYLERNKNRRKVKQIEESHIVRAYNKKKNLIIPDNIEQLTPEEFLNKIKVVPEKEIINADKYNKIHFFGDLQGCSTGMLNYLKTKGEKNDLFVFVGDYFDRGIENGEVAQFLNKTKELKNFIFIRGNHDENIYRYAVRKEFNRLPISDEFINNTLPQIEKVGLSDEKSLMKIYDNMKDYAFIKFGNRIIFANHAGLSNVPQYANILSRYVYQNGDGDFTHDVDNAFSKYNKNDKIIQIHGHRNDFSLPVINKNSINLEGGVEYGQHLRVLEMERINGEVVMKPHEIKNNIYAKGKLKYGEKELEFNEVAQLVYQTNISYKNNLELVDILRNNDLIFETASEKYPHISSFNFKKKAFYEGEENHFQDEGVSHARGLFINTETGEIVGRGFEKFFNTNEKEETKVQNIENNYSFPISLYQKENGFFAIIGYDEKSDELIYTSKSRIDGEYPEYVKEIAKNTFNEEELNRLKRYAQRFNVNYIFEAIDIKNDPHIVRYEENKMVLLSIVKRDFSFQDVTYESLKDFTKSFEKLTCKEKIMSFQNAESFNGFFKRLNEENVFSHEGFVAEDQNSKKFKIKTPFYNGWKLVRNSIENHNRRYFKLTDNAENASRDKVKEGFIKERNLLEKKSIARFNSNLDNQQIFNEQLRDNLRDFFKREISNPKKDFNSIYFYEKRNEYLDDIGYVNPEMKKRKNRVSLKR